MNRTVMPNLFSAWGAVLDTSYGPRAALRWMTDPRLGLPMRHFTVWHLSQSSTKTQKADVRTREVRDGHHLHTWPGERAAAVVQVMLDVTGGRVHVRAHTGPSGSGQTADEATVVGPVSGAAVTLAGPSIRSVTTTGAARVTGIVVLDLQRYVNDPGWTPLEYVGLPVDKRFAGEYPLDPQGPPGGLLEPVKAAVRRVERGTPADFWPAATDTGAPVPPFTPPDPERLVREELKPTMEMLAAMLEITGDRSRHADVRLNRSVAPPRSVHGVDAPGRWVSTSTTSLPPLQAALLAAGSDPYAALALGFGTSIDGSALLTVPPAFTHGFLPSATASLPLMVTLEHKADYKLEVAGRGISLPIEGELAALVVIGGGGPPPRPSRLLVNAGRDRPRLDRPGVIDGPWLEIVDLTWDAERTAVASALAPSGCAVLRSVGGSGLAPALGKRPSGGHRIFVPGPGDDGRVRFTESAVPERFPGEGAGAAFAVAAQDWFGRWGPWSSAEHTRIVVPPQRPVMRRITIDQDGPIPAAIVEFTWDWADRTPEFVAVRVQVFIEDEDPPAVDGSVLSPGGPVVPDRVLSFSGASMDSPPTSVTEIIEEREGTLRTYSCTIPGLALPFAAHPRLRIQARARATEDIRPGIYSERSAPVGTSVHSPLLPAAPVTAAPMKWTSLPDAAGVCRAVLSWSGSGPTYTVYIADESAIARELGLPSPDLDVPAAERLAALRGLDFGLARRAFRRLTERLAEPRLEVSLAKGTQLIHFYGITTVSDTEIERPLPADANQYVAVAPPVRLEPASPLLTARPSGGSVGLVVAVAAGPVPVERVEIGRVRGRSRAVLPEAAGAPILVATASSGTEIDGVLHWELSDADLLPPWQPVYYRAVAVAAAEPSLGQIAGRSAPTPAVEVVVPSPAAPNLTDLTVEPAADGTGGAFVAFRTDAAPIRTRLGSFTFAITTIQSGPGGTSSAVMRGDLADLPSHTGPRPDGPGPYLHRPTDADPYRVTARLAAPPLAVTAEVTDPLGRRTSRSAP